VRIINWSIVSVNLIEDFISDLMCRCCQSICNKTAICNSFLLFWKKRTVMDVTRKPSNNISSHFVITERSPGALIDRLLFARSTYDVLPCVVPVPYWAPYRRDVQDAYPQNSSESKRNHTCCIKRVKTKTLS
jgi:hypothetical protein